MIDESIFKKQLKEVKRKVGARYTPSLNKYKGFPSIQMQDLLSPINYLGRTKEFWKEIEILNNKLSMINTDQIFTHLKVTSNYLKTRSNICHQHAKKITKSVENLLKVRKKTGSNLDLKPCQSNLRIIQKSLREISAFLYEEKSKINNDDQKNNQIIQEYNEQISEVRKLTNLFNNADEILENKHSSLINDPKMILLGEAGIGKTHFLCDVVAARIKNKLPTLLFLAQDLPFANNDLWENIIHALGLSCSKKQFFRFLKKHAQKTKTRALVIVDAINEGERKQWKKCVKKFLNDLEAYPEIGIILSCRMPFEQITLPTRILKNLIKIYHYGFAGVEIEAQTQFFKWYKLPFPEAPLLSDEYKNPLFLKVFCESLHSSVVNGRHRRIRDIASGQEGMTKIFEDYIKGKQAIIERKMRGRLSVSATNWLWNNLIKDLAGLMADKLVDFIKFNELLIFLKKYLTNARFTKELATELINEGILMEGIKWDKTGAPLNVVRFSYQRLSDHLIIRYILGSINYRNKSKIQDLTKKLIPHDNLMEALIIDFPKRRKRSELFNYFPAKEIPGNLVEAFINGLHWRHVSAFNGCTIKFINILLRHDGFRNQTLEALFSLAMKPLHCLNAKKFSRYLRSMRMPERDLRWSEFLRGLDESSSVYKLLDWVITHEASKLSKEFGCTYIILLQCGVNPPKLV